MRWRWGRSLGPAVGEALRRVRDMVVGGRVRRRMRRRAGRG